MVIEVPTLRDFMDEETLKHLPSNLRVEPCILLMKNEGGRDGETVLHRVMYVFDSKGGFLGKIDPVTLGF